MKYIYSRIAKNKSMYLRKTLFKQQVKYEFHDTYNNSDLFINSKIRF